MTSMSYRAARCQIYVYFVVYTNPRSLICTVAELLCLAHAFVQILKTAPHDNLNSCSGTPRDYQSNFGTRASPTGLGLGSVLLVPTELNSKIAEYKRRLQTCSRSFAL